MVGYVGGSGSGFDYVQADTPNNPQNGELWFDTDGGSDGNGEAKVYDGSAWEPTGYTRHGDLTGVTRDAHHPPVSVSGPLTQPSDQSLGLSIGDGLTDANGTLVAALGDGLGIDASGQVYVPASAVSQSMLAFDTATQGELDAHAGDNSAHHSPPSQTQNHDGGGSSINVNISGQGMVGVACYSVDVSNTADWARKANLHYADGTTQTKDIDGSGTIDADPNKLLVWFSSEQNDVKITSLEAANTPRHSHNI